MHGPREPQFIIPGIVGAMLAMGNIPLDARPVVHNPDGSISTVDSTSFAIPGRGEVLIPQVVGNQVVSPRDALAAFLRTGKNLGAFKTSAAADRYAQALHREQAIAYAAGGGR